MFGIGVGPALILFVVVSAAFFDIPPTITMPIAAAIMCLVAYAVSRERWVLKVGFATALILSSNLVMSIAFIPENRTELPGALQEILRFTMSSDFVIGVCAVSMILVAVIGIYGPLGLSPTHAESDDRRNR